MAGVASYATGTTSAINESIMEEIKSQQSRLNSESTFSIRHIVIWSETDVFTVKFNDGEYIPTRENGSGVYEFSLVGVSDRDSEFVLIRDIAIGESGVTWKATFVY